MTEYSYPEDALCAQTNPDLFFPELGDTAAAYAAKRVCADCPVRLLCAEGAIARGERFGIWGGMGSKEIHRIRRGRGLVDVQRQQARARQLQIAKELDLGLTADEVAAVVGVSSRTVYRVAAA